MLTKNILFGMNILTVGGFVLMGFALTLSRRKQLRLSLAIALMGAGTALVCVGVYFAVPVN